MHETRLHEIRTKLIATAVVAVVVVGAVAGGRHLIGGSSARPSASVAPKAATAAPSGLKGAPLALLAPQGTHGTASAAAGLATPDAHSASAGTGSGLAAVPVFATPPLVVHTATVAMRVGKGELNSALHSIAALAAADGGYVDRSSLSGGTAHRSPVSGTIVFRVLDSDFADAITRVSGLGTVDSQQIQGKDVTVQVAQNAASIFVLGDEVALLEEKLGQASDIGTFLQIQNQLFPVVQQLQQLQAAQAVLQNSAALATVTVGLTAPGAILASAPAPAAGPHPASATVAWRYLRHNTLAVLDALAVAGGWALPVLVALALFGVPALRTVRRRRHAVNPA